MIMRKVFVCMCVLVISVISFALCLKVFFSEGDFPKVIKFNATYYYASLFSPLLLVNPNVLALARYLNKFA